MSKAGAKSGKELRRRVVAEHRIDSAAALTLLDAAAEALDMAVEAEKILRAEGLTTASERGGLRAHPLVAVARDARLRLVSSLKALHLEL